MIVIGNYYSPFPLRVSEELLGKIKRIALLHKRSANREIEYVLESYVAQYEAQNGPLPDLEDR